MSEQRNVGGSPFGKLLGIEVFVEQEGRSRSRMAVKPELTQSMGYVHGGVLATLLDMAIGAAVRSTLPEGQRTVTVELKINYLKAVKGKVLVAEGEVEHRGNLLSVGRCRIYNELDELIATGLGTFIVVK